MNQLSVGGLAAVAPHRTNQRAQAKLRTREKILAAAKALFATEVPDAADRRALLSGRAATASAGPVVCACHGVGADVIATTIAGGAASVEAVGAACKAGTNCGSCIPEIRKMLAGQTACAA